MNTKYLLYAEKKIRQKFQARFYGRHVRSAATGVLVEKTTCWGIWGLGSRIEIWRGSQPWLYYSFIIFKLGKTKEILLFTGFSIPW